ncbi:MAG TPA: DUF4838 domain-containing protein [Candidatus Hydrogenedentes bacterium]|nr:DUF4838 domain-containing protein [Candidatus Hydrogenedentota bacterium]
MNKTKLSRREALGVMAAGAMAALNAQAAEATKRFVTCGVVLYPWDLTLKDWPERAAKAGITTIGLHAARRLDVLVDFVKSDDGQKFLRDCQRLGVQVEYEVHALGTLLSRELYYQDLTLFRMDEKGQRNIDFGCCASSSRALEIIAEKAVEYGRVLNPTTGRYFYWPDDGYQGCFCEKCKGLNWSDQTLLIENAMVEALRKHLDPKATLSHISYGMTLEPPKSVKPQEGVFVEFAPISRVYDRSIAERDVVLGNHPLEPKSHEGYLEILDANLEVFGRETAQVLEYWLDVSRFSGWKRPAKILPWSDEVIKADGDAYAKRGIRHVTSFATWIDADYVQRFGAPPLAQYVAGLQG